MRTQARLVWSESSGLAFFICGRTNEEEIEEASMPIVFAVWSAVLLFVALGIRCDAPPKPEHGDSSTTETFSKSKISEHFCEQEDENQSCIPMRYSE